MTDERMIELIAEMMGCSPVSPRDCNDYREWWVRPGETQPRIFNPLTSDADCMVAWDAFAADSRCTRIACDVQSSDGVRERVCIAEITDWCDNTLGYAKNKDRRRAMCECMAKAVAE